MGSRPRRPVLTPSRRAWRDAGKEVVAACDKYEAYLQRSASVYGKVREVRQRLAVSQLKAEADEGAAAHVSHAAADLRLADILLSQLGRRQLVENGLSHLMLLTAGGEAATAGGTAESRRLEELAMEERRIVAEIRSALGPGRRATTVSTLNLEDLDCWDARTEPLPTATAASSDQEREAQWHLESPPTTSASLFQRWSKDPLLQALLGRAAELGLPPGHILLERAALQHLLRNHPSRALRREVYIKGVLPRKEALLRLRADLAFIR